MMSRTPASMVDPPAKLPAGRRDRGKWQMDARLNVVRSYKQLAHAERAFRTLKSPELTLIVRNTNRVRGKHATFNTVTEPNPTQTRALQLLDRIPEPA